MKKVYVASRVREKGRVRALIERLEKKDYQSVTTWLDHEDIPKPLSNNPELAKKIAAEAVEAIAHADIFILLCDDAGTGIYIELGVALRESTARTVEIFLVGSQGANSVFTYHPNVALLATEEELINRL